MRNRRLRVIALLLSGCCLRVVGCQSEELAMIVSSGIKNTAIEAGTFVIGSAVDNFLGVE